MARFSGPAGRGASRTMHAVRRAEAETRQAAYDALGGRRGARRIKPGTAEYVEPEPLTATRVAELFDAMLRADALRAYRQTWTGGGR